MKWFFSLSEASIDRPDHDWRALVRTGVLSCIRNTTLQPHMLYDGKDNDFTAELQELGVTLIHHRVSFHDALAKRGKDYLAIASGAFLRVEIPLIELNDELAFYTDCDVIFRSNPIFDASPRYFAVAPQESRTDFVTDMNSGVMLMNLPAMRAELPQFTDFITSNLDAGWPGCDQENYRRFYKGRWSDLALTYNWKPYWGTNPAAVILHWHGPKPTMAHKLLKDPNLKTNADWSRLVKSSPEGYRAWLTEWDQSAKVEDVVCYLDDMSPQGMRGWAMNRADGTIPTTLRLFIDGVEIDKIVCDKPRPDVAKAGAPEGVGYLHPIPRSFFDGKPHIIELRRADNRLIPIRSRGQEVLSYELRQRWHPKVISHLDGVREGTIKGWVVCEDPASKRRTGGAHLLITCEGERLGQIKANQYRPDVAKLNNSEPDCGFTYLPPPAFRRSRPQSFRFYLLPYEIELEGSPCVTSFATDAHQAALGEFSDSIDRMYREITSLRRQMRLVLPRPVYSVADYDSWAAEYFIALRAAVLAKRHITARHVRHDAQQARPLVSIICPVYQPKMAHFVLAVESVIAQTYENWQLILVDDGSRVPELTDQIDAFVRRDPRIRHIKRAKNGGISAATNVGIKSASGAWILFFDHDDLLVDVAVEMMVTAALSTNALVIYSDEDKIDDDGLLSEPAFKPDWNYRLLLSVNYVCHLLMIRCDVMPKTGLQHKYNGAQDHALLLRLAETVPAKQIHHVQEVLYHWRKSQTSTASSTEAKSYAVDAGIAVVSSHLSHIGRDATVTNINGSTWYRITWEFTETPKVAIIIPFKENIPVTRECINRVLAGTDYADFEVILVDNWSTSLEASEFCEEITELENVSVLRVEEEFNYSRLNNLAAAKTDAPFLVLMNNDLYVTDKSWLRTLVNEALVDDEVAIVGGKYLYPNGTVQHAGVILGVGGVATHVHTGIGVDDPGYGARALFAQEASAVTAACLLIRSAVYRDIGGLDETYLKVAFNDVDLCLKARAAGWKIIWTPDFVAEHHESLSRGDDEASARTEARFFDEMETMKARWGQTLKTDPFYNRAFSLDGRPFFDLIPPAHMQGV